MESASEKPSSVEFGPKYVNYVSFSDINEIEQIRKSYPTEQIEELADAIDMTTADNTDPEFNLLNPLLVAKLSPKNANTYLAEHANFYKTKRTNLSDLASSGDDLYYILISGHRRKRAVSSLTRKYEIDPGLVKVSSNVYENISFEDALVLQSRENIHERVSPHEEAEHIAQYFDYFCRTRQRRPTHREIALRLGKSEHAVSSALAFKSLPESIQKYANMPKTPLSYSTLVRFKPLMEAYSKYHDAKKIEEEKEPYVTNQLHIMALSLWKLKLENNRKNEFEAIIRNKIESLRAQSSWDQNEFLIEGWAPPKSEEQLYDTSKRLGESAISALQIATRFGQDLIPNHVQALEELIKNAKAVAKPSSDSLF